MTTKNAVALRAFTHAGDSFAKGEMYEIDKGHFADWSADGVSLVREATADELKAAKETAAKAIKAKSDTAAGEKPTA